MLEFAREHAVGLAVALLLHVVLLAVLVVSLPLRPSVPAPGTRAPVQAVAVSESALRAAEVRDRQAREAEERQRREAEQRRQEEVRRQAEAERQREAEQQAQAAAAQRAQAEREQRERRVAEERRQAEAARQAEEARKEQAKREAEARQKAEAEAKRQAEARQKAEAEAKRQAEERARAEAARQAEEARQQAERQRQLAAQIESEERLTGLQSSPEYGAWLGAIQDQVARNWNRPASARAGLECEVRVSLIPGMQVVNAEVLRCNGDDAVRRSIIAAVERASPLPRPSDPALFERSIVFVFKPQD